MASVPLPLLGRSQSAGFKSLSALVDSDDEWVWHVITDLLLYLEKKVLQMLHVSVCSTLTCCGFSLVRWQFSISSIRKAYAKLHGTYDSIEGGFVNDGLVDMTGDMHRSQAAYCLQGFKK